jgi:hypothetical protein
MTENSTSLEPFTIAVPGEDLADLTRRLKAPAPLKPRGM